MYCIIHIRMHKCSWDICHCDISFFSSIATDIIMASSDTVGKLATSWVLYSLCDLLTVHPLAYTMWSHFSLMNIRYRSDIFFSSFDSSSFLSGKSVSLECNGCNSFSRSTLHLCLNFSIRALTLVWVIIMCTCGLVNILWDDCCSFYSRFNCCQGFTGQGLKSYPCVFPLVKMSFRSSLVSGSMFICAAFISVAIFCYVLIFFIGLFRLYFWLVCISLHTHVGSSPWVQ